MDKYITSEQREEILEEQYGNRYRELLKEYTGIKAKPYTEYQFYDADGEYIGDSQWMDIDELMEEAGIKVSDGGAAR